MVSSLLSITKPSLHFYDDIFSACKQCSIHHTLPTAYSFLRSDLTRRINGNAHMPCEHGRHDVTDLGTGRHPTRMLGTATGKHACLFVFLGQISPQVFWRVNGAMGDTGNGYGTLFCAEIPPLLLLFIFFGKLVIYNCIYSAEIPPIIYQASHAGCVDQQCSALHDSKTIQAPFAGRKHSCLTKAATLLNLLLVATIQLGQAHRSRRR